MNFTIIAYVMALMVCIFLPQALNIYFNSQRDAESAQ